MKQDWKIGINHTRNKKALAFNKKALAFLFLVWLIPIFQVKSLRWFNWGV